jgi:sugar lactone lactonase YvrE
MRIRTVALAAAAFVSAFSPSTGASSARFFRASVQADFLKGDVENLSVDTRGQLVLGPATELVYETVAPFVWVVAAAPDGTLYLGTGNEGRVYRVDPAGNATTFFDSGELEVHALAVAPGGELYVGTSPDGRIYKVARDGSSAPFFDPQEKYIWALGIDRDGYLYAATGEKGVVYRIAPDGTGAPFYRTKATHATALAFDARGAVLIGTESPGRVFRVDAGGRGFVLLDTAFEEVRGLRADETGTLYVGALNGRRAGSGPPVIPNGPAERPPTESGQAPVATVTVTTEVTSIAVVDGSRGAGGEPPRREDRRAVKGAVYRVAPDGLWDQVWESRDDAPYDLALDASGSLIVATGNDGKIYRLEGPLFRPTLLARANARQVTAFHRDTRGRLYYTTANPGKLFRLSAGRADRGTYESEALDAEIVASWGTIVWHGSTPDGSRVELFTRSGNTAVADETWSPWSAAYASPEGSSITSPKARYLQWRAVLTAGREAPTLTSVTASYLQRNLRPVVRSVTVHPAGVVFQKPFSTGEPDLAGFGDQTTPDRQLAAAAASPPPGQLSGLALGRRSYQRGLQTFAWRADDENDDELLYDVLYRREGELEWTPLRRGLSESIFVWDTTTVRNGTYFVRIVASDAPSNAPDLALTGERDSSAFTIDHTPPAISVDRVRAEASRTIVSLEVTDSDSAIERVELSRDGGRNWTAVFPADGIADSEVERYEVTLDGTIGEHGLTIRALDALHNVGTAHVDGAPGR